MNFRNYVTTEKDKIQKTAEGQSERKCSKRKPIGSFGIKSLETKWITGRQIEAARIAVTRYMQRQGQIWIRIFPDKPITRKPADVRMGKGKGNVEYWVALIQPGKVLYEMDGVPEELAREAFKLAAAKLPIKTTFVTKTVM